MEPPLTVDKDDPRWELLSEVLKIFGSRRVKLVMAKSGLTPVGGAGVCTRIALAAVYFSQDIAYVASELKERKDLRRFVGIVDVPKTGTIYRFLGRFTAEQLVEMALKVLNSVCSKRGRGKTVIADCTDTTLDLSWFRKKIKKADLEDREFKWATPHLGDAT